MGLYMVINDYSPEDLTSATGWGDVIEWADGLDLSKYEEIVRLAEHGHSTDLPRLARELKKAIRSNPPDQAGTRGVVRALYKAVKRRDTPHQKDGYIIISDGMGADLDAEPLDEVAEESNRLAEEGYFECDAESADMRLRIWDQHKP